MDDSARGPFKAGGVGGVLGGGGTGGFCLETTFSNLLQDADISRNTAVGVSWGRGCHSPRCEIKTAWPEPAGCGGEGRNAPACSLLTQVHVFCPDPRNSKFPPVVFAAGSCRLGPIQTSLSSRARGAVVLQPSARLAFCLCGTAVSLRHILPVIVCQSQY